MGQAWRNDVIRHMLDVAASDRSVRRLRVDLEDEGLEYRVDIRPVDMVEPGMGVRRRQVLLLETADSACTPTITAHLPRNVAASAAELEPPKHARRPNTTQQQYYKLYAEAAGRAPKDEPLHLATQAARMGWAESTLRHYYYADPADGKRYKTDGLGWGAAPGCRAFGERGDD